MSGAAAHKWFHVLERLVPGNSARAALTKITAHSFVYAPIQLSTFNVWIAATDIQNPQPCKQRVQNQVRDRTFRMWRDGCVFWIPIVMLQYRFIPTDFRVLATGAANLLWTTYLSLHGPGQHSDQADSHDKRD
jgi:Mpv17 / PMP22 family